MPLPPQGLGQFWAFIKSKLQSEGALNVKYDSNLDGKIDAEVTGYCSKYDSDLDGVIDWKALRFFGVRQEILKNFDDPKLLIATSSMLQLLNSADKAGSNTAGISATSKELTIVGGTSTTTGTTWIYLSLPENATKVYATANLNNVNCNNVDLELFAGSDPTVAPGSTGDTRYDVQIVVPNATNDFVLAKHVNGVYTVIASEAIDLSNDVYYKVEMFLDNENSILQVFRDNVLKFNVTPDITNLPSITAVRFFVHDVSTTIAQSGKFKGPVVIIYE